VSFKLDSRLEVDSFFICDLALAQLRLINDEQFIWLVLIPRVNDVKEIIDLSEKQQEQLWKESACVSSALRSGFSPHKLNVAAIGNIVEQLHVHHICRFTNDVAWPAPVWGRQEMKSYSTSARENLLKQLYSLIKKQRVD
jgi:diadenosine tetraphosphate (Ap4A) HIT family hydrolase